MLSERQHHYALEIKQNISALDPVELLLFANNSKMPRERLRAHLIECAVLAKWAQDESDTQPDPAFKIMETELLGRVNREFQVS